MPPKEKGSRPPQEMEEQKMIVKWKWASHENFMKVAMNNEVRPLTSEEAKSQWDRFSKMAVTIPSRHRYRDGALEIYVMLLFCKAE